MVVVLDEQYHYNIQLLLNGKSFAEEGICAYNNQVAHSAKFSKNVIFLDSSY